MSSLTSHLLPFAIYWLLLFVACYLIVEFAQNYLYDETTPKVGLKILGGSFLLALLLTYTRSSFDTMFTSEIHFTVLQALAWFVVFMFIFRFQPLHAAAIGIVAMIIVSANTTLAIDSLRASQRPRPELRAPSKPVRRPSGGAPVTFEPVTPAATKPTAAP